MRSKFVSVFLFFLGVGICQHVFAERKQETSGLYIGPSLLVSQLLGEQTLTYFNNDQGLYGAKFKGHHATFSWGGG